MQNAQRKIKKVVGAISVALLVSGGMVVLDGIIAQQFPQIPFERPLLSTIGVATVFGLVIYWYAKD